MASLRPTDATRRKWLLQVACPNGQRRSVRLALPELAALGFKQLIEALVRAVETGTDLADDDRRQLARLSPAMLKRLQEWGLIEAPQESTLGAFLVEFFASLDVKPSTAVTYAQTRDSLKKHFGEGCPLRTIGPMQAEKWRQTMRDAGKAEATIARRAKLARQMFRRAVKWGLTDANPFDDMRAGSQENRERMFFVTREVTDKLIEHAPNPEWKLLIALARYGGLRIPSEAFALKWGDVDWEAGKIVVTSPKTEGVGKASRTIPLWPELVPHLLAAFSEAGSGEHVISSDRNPARNLRTRLSRIIRRAKLEAWPRLWQNLRSSRETELARDWPMHHVCAWIGNSPAVAAKHYLQITDADYERASGGPKRAALALHQPEKMRSFEGGSDALPRITPYQSAIPLNSDPSGIRTPPPENEHKSCSGGTLGESAPKLESAGAAPALQTAQFNAPEPPESVNLGKLAAELARLSEADRERLAAMLKRGPNTLTGGPG